MWEEFQEFTLFMGTMVAAVLLLIAAVMTPIAYFDGKAKSAYIKQVQGVDIPWYQATFLDVQVNNVNAKVEVK